MNGTAGHIRIALVTAMTIWPLAVSASDRDPGMVGMIASLQRLQDQVAQGLPGTREAQTELVRYIDTYLRQRSGSEPYSEKTRDAALTYMLIGGNARALLSLELPMDDDEESDEEDEAVKDPLLEFAKLVRKSRGQIDPNALKSLDASRTGRIVKAPLALEQARAFSEPDDVIRRLRIARTAGTGTLVEEAALRQLAAIHLSSNQFNDYLAVVSRYVRAFARSPYAMGTYAGFARFAASDNGAARRDDIKDIIAFLPTDLRNAMRRSVRRQSVLNGNLELATHYDDANEARQQKAVSPLVDAIIAFDERGEKDTMGVLRNIDASLLPNADRELLQAAKKVFSEFESLDGGPAPVMPDADDMAGNGDMLPTDAETAIDDSHFSSIEGDLKRLSDRVKALGIDDDSIGVSQ